MADRTLYDITRSLAPTTPVWPGDEPLFLSWVARIVDGSAVNLAALRTGLHAGTHVDAPFHILANGPGVGDLPLAPFMGPALVAAVATGPGRLILPEDLRDALLARPERLLIRTGAWTRADTFPEDFAALSPEAAEALVSAGIRLVGTDAPSVDPFDSVTLPAHHRLLGAGIPILENLDLGGVPEGSYELIALPLRLSEADASPVRAILRRIVRP